MSSKTMAIAASGLHAQRIRLQTISANMANINTTRGPGGQAFQRLVPLFRPEVLQGGFDVELDDQRKLYGVRVERVATADREPLWVYNPDHPDADESGYVGMPNINVVEEMRRVATRRTWRRCKLPSRWPSRPSTLAKGSEGVGT